MQMAAVSFSFLSSSGLREKVRSLSRSRADADPAVALLWRRFLAVEGEVRVGLGARILDVDMVFLCILK